MNPSPDTPRRVCASVALLVFLLAAGEAAAAGFYLPGRGVKPLGRGGALVVSGEGDLNSLWYNPANLAPLDELTLTIDLALIHLDFEHTRAPRELPNGESRTYETVHNQAPPKLDPQVLIGGPLGVDGLAWAFGVYAPYLSGHTFPEDGPQRYVLVDNDPSMLLFLHLAVAYQVGDHIRIGAGFQNVPAHFVLINVASGYTGLFGDPEDEDLDILTKIELVDLFAPSGNVGVWVKLADPLEAGLSAQLPVVFKANRARLTARLPSHPEFQGATLQGDTLTASLKFPPVMRAGLRFVHPAFDVEAAVVWEGWSILSELHAAPNDIRVDGLPGLGSIPVGPLTIPLEYRDTISVRLGSDVALGERAKVRAGYIFETAAIPDETYSVFLADSSKHVGTVGASFVFNEHISLDASFGYYFLAPRTVTNSRWRQINPTDDEGKVTLIVGNGTYRQTYVAGGLGMNVAF